MKRSTNNLIFVCRVIYLLVTSAAAIFTINLCYGWERLFAGVHREEDTYFLLEGNWLLVVGFKACQIVVPAPFVVVVVVLLELPVGMGLDMRQPADGRIDGGDDELAADDGGGGDHDGAHVVEWPYDGQHGHVGGRQQRLRQQKSRQPKRKQPMKTIDWRKADEIGVSKMSSYF
jgi:hypothetical protein